MLFKIAEEGAKRVVKQLAGIMAVSFLARFADNMGLRASEAILDDGEQQQQGLGIILPQGQDQGGAAPVNVVVNVNSNNGHTISSGQEDDAPAMYIQMPQMEVGEVEAEDAQDDNEGASGED